MAKPRKVRETRAGSTVPASELKNAWHEYLDRISHGNEEIVVTRYGKPVAKLVPYGAGPDEPRIFGCLSGTVTIVDDIIEGTGVTWDADS